MTVFLFHSLRHVAWIVDRTSTRQDRLNVRDFHVIPAIPQNDRVHQSMEQRPQETMIGWPLGRQSTLEVSHAGDSSNALAQERSTISRGRAARGPGSSIDC